MFHFGSILRRCFSPSWLTKLVKGLFSRTLDFDGALPKVSTTTWIERSRNPHSEDQSGNQGGKSLLVPIVLAILSPRYFLAFTRSRFMLPFNYASGAAQLIG